MTTSGTTAYDRTGAQIIDQALRLIQVLGEDDTITSNQTANGLVALNLMVKSDQKRLGLWRFRQAKLFLVDGTAEYSLSGAKAADISEISETTLDANEAASQTVLSVTSTSQGASFANSDVIGIVLDDDTIHWTTISSFVADDTVTVATGLASAASSGNKVFAYTTAAPRPMKIISARRENISNEIPMFKLSREEYFDLPNKGSLGTPVQFYYDPQRATGKIYLWPTPDTVDDEINYDYLDELEIFSASSDTSDFPSEWMEYLVYGLAIRLAPTHGAQVSNEVLVVYTDVIKELELWDTEDVSIIFSAEG